MICIIIIYYFVTILIWLFLVLCTTRLWWHEVNQKERGLLFRTTQYILSHEYYNVFGKKYATRNAAAARWNWIRRVRSAAGHRRTECRRFRSRTSSATRHGHDAWKGGSGWGSGCCSGCGGRRLLMSDSLKFQQLAYMVADPPYNSMDRRSKGQKNAPEIKKHGT